MQDFGAGMPMHCVRIDRLGVDVGGGGGGWRLAVMIMYGLLIQISLDVHFGSVEESMENMLPRDCQPANILTEIIEQMWVHSGEHRVSDVCVYGRVQVVGYGWTPEFERNFCISIQWPIEANCTKHISTIFEYAIVDV